MEVNAIRDRRGDVQLRDDLRLALLRAGRAEAALRVAERRLERVGEIVAGDLRQALTGDVGEL